MQVPVRKKLKPKKLLSRKRREGQRPKKPHKYSSEEKRANSLRNLAPPWRPGQSGNPRGRPIGSGSVTMWLKRRMLDQPTTEGFEDLAEELAAVIITLARQGNLGAIKEVVDLTESRPVTVEELRDEVDKVYEVVSRHVSELEGGRDAMAAIAQELGENSHG